MYMGTWLIFAGKPALYLLIKKGNHVERTNLNNCDIYKFLY